MRRITVFTDEESAQKLVEHLEAEGLDYMSEDYREPSIQRRAPPTRRAEPERPEASVGLLKPLRPPAPKKLSTALLEWLQESGGCTFDELVGLATDRGWSRKKLRDTLYRMMHSNKVLKVGDRYHG